MLQKFFLIAGETSGDVLGSKIIKELKIKNSKSEFIGVGGKLMKEQGMVSIFPMEDLSVMGFFEIVPHIPKLLCRINQTCKSIIEERPDFIITIDSPDFCFRVMKKVSQAKISQAKISQAKISQAKKIHLIAPSVWAYRPKRAEKISKLYDLLLAILPFEPPYFEKYGLRTVFIGHPIVEVTPDFSKKDIMNSEFRKKYGIKMDDFVICVTPGSRNSEVKRIFPEFIGAINLLSKVLPNLKVVIPLIDKTTELVSAMAKNIKVEYFLTQKEEREDIFFSSDFGLAKSGTNAVELSLYKIPIIVAYKINPLTHFFLKRFIKVKFANLINLILNKEVIPEMIQKNCEAVKLFEVISKAISDKKFLEAQINESEIALNLMRLKGSCSSSKKAAEEILK